MAKADSKSFIDFFLKYVNEFRTEFEKNNLTYLQSAEVKKSLANTLLGRMISVFDKILENELRKELEKINLFYAVDMELASPDVFREAHANLAKRIEEDSSVLSPGLLHTTIEDFRNLILDFHSDFIQNKKCIEETLFGGKIITEIRNISSASFSAYNKGRFTLLITTDAGKFVYKRHDCRNDVWMHEFLERYFKGYVYSPKCFAYSDICGFCEFIDSKIPNKEEILSFYENLGVLAAIGRGLGLSDLHYGNVISKGTIAVIIDNEMLFQPLNLTTVDELLYGQELDIGYSFYLNRSVLGHCIVESENSPLRNIPGTEFSYEYKNAFKRGFLLGYDKICKNKTSILEEVKSTSDFQIRRIIRELKYYKAWIGNLFSNEPQSYMNSIHNTVFPNPQIFCEYEMSFLKNGNYPYFYTFVSSRDLYGTDGKVLIKDYLAKSPFEMVCERLDTMDEDNKRFEQSLLNTILFYEEKKDFKDDYDYVDYYEKQMITSQDGENFWLSPNKEYRSMDLPPDAKKGSLAIAKRCAFIAGNTDKLDLKQRAEKLVKAGVFSLERILLGNIGLINSEKLKEAVEAIKYIAKYVPDVQTSRIIKKLEDFYGHKT